MNARHIISLFTNAFRAPVQHPLGRWNIHSHKQTMLKIQYANEDNCGTCGEYDYNSNQIETKPERNQEFDEDEQYVYMMGLETVPTDTHTAGK